MDLFVTVPVDAFRDLLEPVAPTPEDAVALGILANGFRREKSVDFTIELEDAASKKHGFRVNAVLCDNGQSVNIIARDVSDLKFPTLKYFACAALTDVWNKQPIPDPAKPVRPYFSMPPSVLLGKQLAKPGLFIVFGATGSGKSVLADTIAQYAIHQCRNTGHVLRFGDPVEGTLSAYSGLLNEFCDLEKHPLETQRNSPFDVKDIQRFGTDALRQKPSVITLSELRNDSEIRAAIELASTGHFVVATAHAGSLRDGFLRLMKALDCFQYPDLRVPLVKALNSVIHISREDATVASGKCKVALPTVWTRGEKSEQHFVTSGIEYIYPSTDDDAECKAPLYYYTEEVPLAICALTSAIDSIIRMNAGTSNEVSAPFVCSSDLEAAMHDCLNPWNGFVEKYSKRCTSDTVEKDRVSRALVTHLATRIKAKTNSLVLPNPGTVNPDPTVKRYCSDLIDALHKVTWK